MELSAYKDEYVGEIDENYANEFTKLCESARRIVPRNYPAKRFQILQSQIKRI